MKLADRTLKGLPAANQGGNPFMNNTNEFIFFTPHPPFPLKGGGLRRG
jgi:hypothetical protein